MSKPISPNEVAAVKKQIFPPEVFDAFNELIAADYDHGRATVYQEIVINLIISKLMISFADAVQARREEHERSLRSQLFASGWLNIEEAYRAEGWKVNYDKPGYNESYRASWEFKK